MEKFIYKLMVKLGVDPLGREEIICYIILYYESSSIFSRRINLRMRIIYGFMK